MDNQQLFRIELIKRINFAESSPKNQYYSFGQFDFININPITINDTLKDLIKNYNDFYLKGKNKDSHTQIIYGFLDTDQVNNFFEKQYDWFYQIVSIVSANNEYIKDITKNTTNDFSYVILKTLDKNSFIFLLRSKTISELISFLTRLATNSDDKFNIIYSILSIKNSYLYTNSDKYKLKNENISVTINFKITDISKFKKFISRFTNLLTNHDIKYYSHYFLGNTDFEIIIPNITSQLFLSYHTDNNILSYRTLNNCIKYMHSHISITSKDTTEIIIESNNSNTNNGKSTDTMRLTLNQILHQISELKKYILKLNKNPEINAVIIKILELLNQLLNYNDSHIEIIKFILPTVYEYVIQICKGILDTNNRKYKALEELYDEVNNLVVNTLNTGHDPFVFPEPYYYSNKLICFYLNYLQILKNFYSDEKIRYEFIISPNLNTSTQIVSLSNQDNNLNRLLVVHIPII